MKEVARQIMGDLLCRAMEPEAWREFDQNNGVVTNSTGFILKLSIAHAGKVMNMLAEYGPVSIPHKKG